MRFLIDAQLPPGLCQWINEQGHEASHVAALPDQPVPDWRIAELAERQSAVLISKDDDFVQLRLPDRFAFLWLRCGNVSNRGLQELLDAQWPSVEARLAAGARFITLS